MAHFCAIWGARILTPFCTEFILPKTHYLTTSELLALKTEWNELVESGHDLNGYLQKVVAWLDEMIERDAVSPLTLDELAGAAGLSGEQLKGLSDMSLEYPGIGQIRQAGLTLEQMRRLQNNAEELREGASAEEQAQYDALLSWLEDAIAQKELEASYAQMDEWIGALSLADFGGELLEDIKKTAESMTTAELEVFLAKALKDYTQGSSTPHDELIAILNSEFEARQAQEDAQDAPTYIHVGGKQAALVAALEVDVQAINASGAARTVALKADKSDAFAWSTTIRWSGDTQALIDSLRAYKVLADGGLEAKAAKVTQNADGTLTLSALSNGNSLYIFVYVPEETPEETPLTAELPTDTPDTAEPAEEPPAESGTSAIPIWVIVAVVVAVAAGVAYLSRRKKD